jgi:hypothetical protein
MDVDEQPMSQVFENTQLPGEELDMSGGGMDALLADYVRNNGGELDQAGLLQQVSTSGRVVA